MTDDFASSTAWPFGEGEMVRRIRHAEWASTALGTIDQWPQSLRTALDLVLATPGPATLLWGPAHVQLYNDAYIAIAQDRHPALLGRPVAEGWPDAYADVIQPLLEATQAGSSTRLTDYLVKLRRPDGRIEERVFDTDWLPVRDDAGAVAGALQTLTEVTEGREAERSLRESEARHRLLIESWAQAVWETDPEGVVVADSPSWRAYTGQTLDGWLGYGWLDAIHPEDRAYAERQWREAVAARALVNAEFRLRSPDGGWRWTNVRAAPVLDEKGRLEKWVGMNIDVDARKRVEQSLSTTEKHQAFLLELSDALRAEPDADSMAQRALSLLYERLALDRTYIARIFGADSPVEIVAECGRDDLPRMPAQLQPADFPEGFQKAAEGLLVVDDIWSRPDLSDLDRRSLDAIALTSFVVAPLHRGAEGMIWAMVAGVQSPRAWTSQEATLVQETAERTWGAMERARAETALRQSEHRRELALEAADMGTFVWHVAEDRGEPDTRMLALFGQPPEGGLSLRTAMATMIHPDDGARYAGAVAEAVRPEGSRELREDIRVRLPSGSWRWLTITGKVSFNAEGRPLEMAGTAVDITQRKLAEAALRESEERQAFLLKLGDEVRPLTDAAEVQERAVVALGTALSVDRCYYAETDWGRGVATIGREYRSHRSGSLVGQHPIARFEHLRVLTAGGEPVICHDFASHPALTDHAQSYREYGVQAMVVVPLVKRGQVEAMMALTMERPRHWTDSEVQLVMEVAERTWAAVERARAEAALRESEARFRQFAQAAPEVVWIRDTATLQWEYLSPAFETIYGLSRHEVLEGDDLHRWADLILPEDRDAALAAIERVRQGEQVTFEYRIRRPSDGEVRWLRNTDFPVRDAAGRIERVGGFGQDITALKRADERLRESERRQRALVEGMPQLVWRAADEGQWTWSSPQWSAYTGLSSEGSRGLGWLDAVHPEDRDRALEAWRHAQGVAHLDVEYRLCHAEEGRHRWFTTRATPVRDEAGAIVEWLGTSTDIDDLRRLQDQQQVMVAELQHRTRNLIAVVHSIAQQTMASTGPTEAFRDEFTHRLEALARVQGLLSRSEEEPVTIDALIRMELDALGADWREKRIQVEGPPVRLRNSVVQTLSLALHELATNARKYGALSNEQGRLEVTWRKYETEKAERLALEWRERDGRPPEGGAQRRGYGRELIERALPYALGARTKFAHDQDGLRCTIDMLLERTARGRS